MTYHSIDGVYERVFKRFHRNYWTIETIVDAIVQAENEWRPKTGWFGHIDASHVYFEGLRFVGDVLEQVPMFELHWGS